MGNIQIHLTILLVLAFLLYQPAEAQNQMPGAAPNTSVETFNSMKKQQPSFSYGVLDEDEESFTTTLFTFNEVTIFSYFNDTEMMIRNTAGDTLYADTLAANTYYTKQLPQGVYSINGSKSYTALAGDATSNSVQGFYAVDQSGRGTSTLLNTYMMDGSWGGEHFIVFAYQDGTSFSIKDLSDNSVLFAGTLDKGEHYTMPDTPYSSFLQVSSNKPVSALSYGDQDYYVPAANGTFAGELFYGFSGYIGNWDNSVTVTSYHDNNPVLVLNSETGDTLAADTLGTGQVLSYAVTEETYWTVIAEKSVTSANIPYVNFSGNYAYMTRAIDETGIGTGNIFYVPTIASRIDVFSFDDGNDVTITHLGEYSDYPYETENIDTVFSGVLDTGDGYYFNSSSGSQVYKVEGTGNVSVLQSNSGHGAEFMPLSFAQELPDIAISEEGLSFDPADSLFSAGDVVQVSLMIYNYGPVEASNIQVALYDGDVTNEGTAPIIGTEIVPFIAGQDSALITTEFIVPRDPEYKTLSLVADPNDETKESNSSNNAIIRSLVPNKDLLPPLPVSITAPSGLTIEADTIAQNPFMITANIFNEGTVPAENVSISMKTFNGLTVLEGSMDTTFVSFEAQGSMTLQWKVRADIDSSGTNRYMIQIDADNAEAKDILRSVYVPDLIPPQKPQSFTAQKSDQSNTKVLLNWNNAIDTDVVGYEVHYGTESGVYNGVDADQGVSPILISTFNEFEFTGLSDTSTYYFALRSFDGSKNRSDFSDEVMLSLATSMLSETSIPKEFGISQNYPNPFNPSTNIQYSLPNQAYVQIQVYDVLGREVASLVNDVKKAGMHQVTFDMSSYSSGIYIYRMKAGSFVQTRKLTLMK